MPPSSIDTRSSWSDALAAKLRPTAVEPVNDSLRNRASDRSGSTVSPAFDVVTTLSTPSGRPASISNSANASDDSGVRLAGLRTMVQPAATAGAILRVPIAIGKFHGVISRQGPTGWRVTMTRPFPVGLTLKRPSMRTASSEYQRRKSAAYVTSAADSAIGLPISSVMTRARSAVRSVSNW